MKIEFVVEMNKDGNLKIINDKEIVMGRASE